MPVDVAGPENGSVVVLLSAGHHGPAAYEAVCQRLHTASLRTVVIATDPRLTAKSVVGILDSINVKWALLVAFASAVPALLYGWVYGVGPLSGTLIDIAHLVIGHSVAGAILASWK